MTQRTRLAALVLALGLVSACGTTAPLETQRQAAGGAVVGTVDDLSQALPGDGAAAEVPLDGSVPGVTDGTTAGGTGTDGGAGGTVGGSAPTSPNGDGGSAVGGAPQEGLGAAPGAGSAAGGPAARPGAPLKVGVVLPDFSAIAASLGAEASTADPFASYKSAFAVINKDGGLAGRKIQAVYHKADGSANSATESQKACARFTEDEKVDIVISEQFGIEAFIRCVGKRGLTVLETSRSAFDSRTLKTLPNYFPPVAMAADRQIRALLEVSAQQGRLARGKDVLGAIVEDCPSARNVYRGTVQPLAKKLGVKVELASINCAAGAGDIPTITSQLQGAALKFRSAGVTRVFAISAAEGLITVLFSKQASQQDYRPGYLLTSNAFPYSNSSTRGADAAVSYAPDQLPGMSGVGHVPVLDVGNKAEATASAKKAQATCRQFNPTLNGYDSASGQRKEELRYFAFATCDTIALLRAVVPAAGGQVSPNAIGAVYPRVLAALPSAAVAGGVFSGPGGRRDGAGEVEPFAWNTGCECFTKVGRNVKY